MASSTRRPACVSQDGSHCDLNSMLTGMTSRPIPSPGIKPIRSDLEAIDECVKVTGATWSFQCPNSQSRMPSHDDECIPVSAPIRSSVSAALIVSHDPSDGGASGRATCPSSGDCNNITSVMHLS